MLQDLFQNKKFIKSPTSGQDPKNRVALKHGVHTFDTLNKITRHLNISNFGHISQKNLASPKNFCFSMCDANA